MDPFPNVINDAIIQQLDLKTLGKLRVALGSNMNGEILEYCNNAFRKLFQRHKESCIDKLTTSLIKLIREWVQIRRKMDSYLTIHIGNYKIIGTLRRYNDGYSLFIDHNENSLHSFFHDTPEWSIDVEQDISPILMEILRLEFEEVHSIESLQERWNHLIHPNHHPFIEYRFMRIQMWMNKPLQLFMKGIWQTFGFMGRESIEMYYSYQSDGLVQHKQLAETIQSSLTDQWKP